MARIQVRARGGRPRGVRASLRTLAAFSAVVSVVVGLFACFSAFLVVTSTSDVGRLLAGTAFMLSMLLASGATIVVCLCVGVGLAELLIGAVDRAARWLEPSPSITTLPIRLARRRVAGRCPFCHVDLDDPTAAHLPRVECGRCRALQHHACLDEAHDRCSACSARLVVAPSRLAA